MAGDYRDKKSEFLFFIQNWINKVISDKLWEKYVDLHINDIDKCFKEKQNWIEGSLFLFGCFLSLVDDKKYDVFLVIPLTCVSKKDLVPLTFELLEKELDITPPSFYLFAKGEKNYEATIKSAKHLSEIGEKINARAYYKEENENNECYRTLYIRK